MGNNCWHRYRILNFIYSFTVDNDHVLLTITTGKWIIRGGLVLKLGDHIVGRVTHRGVRVNDIRTYAVGIGDAKNIGLLADNRPNRIDHIE